LKPDGAPCTFLPTLFAEADMIQTRASVGVPALLLMLACSPSKPAATNTATGTSTSTTPDAAADKAAVGKAHDVLETAYRTSDCNAMVSVVANDGVFEPPNTPSAKGVDGIRDWCQPLYAQMKTKSLAVSNKDIDVSGDIAVDRGDYDWVLTPAKGGADVRSVGRYVTIWHRQSDGSWKTTRLIWNSSEPAPRS
jgi:ketosteroid isomerase-like protein